MWWMPFPSDGIHHIIYIYGFVDEIVGKSLKNIKPKAENSKKNCNFV